MFFVVVEYKNIFIKSIIYIFKFLYKLFVVVGCILIENSYQDLDILGYVYEKKREYYNIKELMLYKLYL